MKKLMALLLSVMMLAVLAIPTFADDTSAQPASKPATATVGKKASVPQRLAAKRNSLAKLEKAVLKLKLRVIKRSNMSEVDKKAAIEKAKADYKALLDPVKLTQAQKDQLKALAAQIKTIRSSDKTKEEKAAAIKDIKAQIKAIVAPNNAAAQQLWEKLKGELADLKAQLKPQKAQQPAPTATPAA